MAGKRMRLVRSKTSFDDMSAFDRQLPLQERRQPIKPPNNQIMTEKQTQKVSQPVATLSIWSSTSTQEHTSHFLDKCNYCRKTIGDKDEIYMYSSLSAFCSSECRIQQMLEDKLRERMMCGQSAEALSWHKMIIHNMKITW
ncbi:hypothetical protein M0R45_017848 [Rubus argutus]|uniref:FLZ-type domain-containing protein n=1 Tax=Rubus argutus TaxID=59490 RepID=A0AAW1XY90_RUBAR